MKAWLSSGGLPRREKVQTLVRIHPLRSWFVSCLVSRPASGNYAGFIKPATHTDEETARLQSPFAQPWCYLDWRDVFRLLSGHYPTVIAPTGSCAHPLASPVLRFIASFQKSLQVATQPLLPTGCSRRYSASLSPDAWPSIPTVPPSAFTCFFPDVIGLP